MRRPGINTTVILLAAIVGVALWLFPLNPTTRFPILVVSGVLTLFGVVFYVFEASLTETTGKLELWVVLTLVVALGCLGFFWWQY